MIKAILTDIEGTTTSLSFVKDVLFPYANQHLFRYVKENATDPVVCNLLAEVNKEVDRNLNEEKAIAQLLQWIDEDKKVKPLKSLQGLIWERGYKQGDFKGHVYEDAAKNLKKWHQQGIALYVYSSGSVYAQKLLFEHSDYGDLTALFSGYFDTVIGHKREDLSYQSIAYTLDISTNNILFLSDIIEELDAARSVGMQTIMLVREGNIDNKAIHKQVVSFNDVDDFIAGGV